MTAKEYLNQAYRIDQRINSKVAQIASLRDLLTKTNAVISDMPGNPNRDRSRVDDIIVKIISIEDEIKTDINTLLSTKSDIMHTIKAVDEPGCQMLLELRYLCFKSWEEISEEMGYCSQHIYRIHTEALEMVEKIQNESK